MYVHIKTFKGWGYHTQKKNNKDEQKKTFFFKVIKLFLKREVELPLGLG